MFHRKSDWWWDFTWTPVSGCIPKSIGCRMCWSLPWLKCHTWESETVYTGAITEAVDGSVRWTGILTALRDGDPMWDAPLDPTRGVMNPALGPGKPNLIFAVVDGDLFVTGRPKADINRVCATLAASKHYGLLCSKYTREQADFFASLDLRSESSVRPWKQIGRVQFLLNVEQLEFHSSSEECTRAGTSRRTLAVFGNSRSYDADHYSNTWSYDPAIHVAIIAA
jgi:hypothetical protein